jgi:signal transduction histidine kinase
MAGARPLRLALLPLSIALGLFAEWAALQREPLQQAATAQDVRLAIADFVVGVTLVACGLIAGSRRPESRIGVLLAAAGFSWFLGTFADSGIQAYADFGSLFATLYRGPIIHAVVSYPTGRVRARVDKAVVAAGYLYAAIAPLGQSEVVTIVVAILVIAVAGHRYLGAAGPRRAESAPALAAAVGFGAILVVGSSVRLAGASSSVDDLVLWGYDVVLFAIALGLTVDLVVARWTRATVTGLLVDLGKSGEIGTLRDRLAYALGDRSLMIGFWLPEEERYVDEKGRPLDLPRATGRDTTLVRAEGRPLAVLVHDPAVLEDGELIESVASGAGIALSNVRLQAEIRRQVEELDTSRRRILESGDTQRRKLEQELREGAERRLAAVESILAETSRGEGGGEGFAATLADTRQELERAQDELRQLAHGIHPRALTEHGLAAALAELVSRASLPVDLRATRERFPAAIEAAVYFVCSEGLANIAKYAQATRGSINVSRRGGALVVTVRDDGIGGASLDRGSGLRGLADRVEALRGTFSVDSRPGGGTRLVSRFPVT